MERQKKQCDRKPRMITFRIDKDLEEQIILYKSQIWMDNISVQKTIEHLLRSHPSLQPTSG